MSDVIPKEVTDALPTTEEEVKFVEEGEVDESVQQAQEKQVPETPADEEDLLTAQEHADLSEDEREELRVARREERRNRKEFRRQKEAEAKRLIAEQQNVIGEMARRLQMLEQKTVNNDVSKLEQAFESSRRLVEFAKEKMKAAMEAQDSDMLVEAQEQYYAARQRVEQINGVRQRINQGMNQVPQQAQRQAPMPDPVVRKNTQAWMEKHEWFNADDPDDDDSLLVKTLDDKVAREGYDPRTPEYWEELDRRIKKYLPHRANSTYNGNNRTTRKPTVGGSSESQSNGAANTWVLSKARKEAMQQAGIWEDTARRNAMIKQYQTYDKEHSNG